jgi:phage-related protein
VTRGKFLRAFLIALDRISDLSFGNCSWARGQATTVRCLRLARGVFELRDQDERAWYRVVYLSRINDVIHVLHCFEKKSREMPRKDFEKAKQRLKAVKARLAEEKRHEKRS